MKELILKIAFCLCAFTLIGCSSTRTIKVVDNKGMPVKEALVISEQPPFIGQPWKLGVYFTDDKGGAKIVANRGSIFKPGYFPVIGGSELSNEVLWSSYSNFSQVTPIYPIEKDKKTIVSTRTHRTVNPIQKDVFVVPIGVCASKRVFYNTKSSIIKVSSTNADILLSERFYFAGAGDSKVSVAERENNIAFYCNEGNSLYKVGVSVSAKVWVKGDIPRHKLTIFTVVVPSTETYLQPEVKCLGSKNKTPDIRMVGKYGDKRPKLFLSPAVKSRLSNVKDQLPCANKHTRELFNYIEKYL